ALTAQFVEIFKKNLPINTSFALWTSATTREQKKIILSKLVSGELKLVLGTRSAVFLPMQKLGAIIVDEEQDSSYMQDKPSPAYHAREIANFKTRTEGSATIFSSATPSMECYHEIKRGRITKISLPEKYGHRHKNTVTVAHLSNPRDLLSDHILDAIKQTIDGGGQALVLHNRRGHSRLIHCKNCKRHIQCNSCELPVILHVTQKAVAQEEDFHSGTLRCHHCGIKRKFPNMCPHCKAPSSQFSIRGTGTQKIDKLLAETFNAPVLRLDRDTRKNSTDIYDSFKGGKTNILVGTQMVSKGWHFPEITLVAILDADTELVMPDFRATEKTFQAIFQTSGRGGRGDTPSTVILQTRHPKHYIFESLAKDDPEIFYEKELDLRKKMGLPPFATLLALEITGKNKPDVERTTETIEAECVSQKLNLEIVGSGPKMFSKIRNKWHYETMLRLNEKDSPVPYSMLYSIVNKVKKAGIKINLRPL
ncbi:primosomal protein N', partial [Elusimicrobiota bacterium]